MANDISGTLQNGSLISFDERVLDTTKRDLLDLLMFVQLSCNDLHDRRQRWMQWLQSYQQLAVSVGLVRVGNLRPSKLKIKSAAELKRLPLDASGVTSSTELKRVADRALDQLLGSEHAEAFFSKWFTAGRSESFEVIPCVSDSQGGATLFVCGMQMHSSALDAQIPWYWLASPASIVYGLSGALTVTSSGGAFRYTPHAFAPFRQKVRSFLEARAVDEAISL
jgi:hypothetical protein